MGVGQADTLVDAKQGETEDARLGGGAGNPERDLEGEAKGGREKSRC